VGITGWKIRDFGACTTEFADIVRLRHQCRHNWSIEPYSQCVVMSCLTSNQSTSAQMKRRLGIPPRQGLASCGLASWQPTGCSCIYRTRTQTRAHAYAKAFCGPFVALSIPGSGKGCGYLVRGLRRSGKCILQPQPTTERNVSAPGANSVAGDGYVRQIALGKCIINRNGAKSIVAGRSAAAEKIANWGDEVAYTLSSFCFYA